MFVLLWKLPPKFLLKKHKKEKCDRLEKIYWVLLEC